MTIVKKLQFLAIAVLGWMVLGVQAQNMNRYITLNVLPDKEISVFIEVDTLTAPIKIVSGTHDTTFMLSYKESYYNYISFIARADTMTFYGDISIFYCNYNYENITAVDASHNAYLSELNCDENFITSLNVRGADSLKILSCNNNSLSSLDVNQNYSLQELYCSNNKLSFLKVCNNLYLTDLGCEYNKLTSLNVEKNALLYYLRCSYNRLNELIMDNSSLCYLYANNNLFQALDVRECADLRILHCENNQLTSLDVSNNGKLEGLYCYNNFFTTQSLDEIMCTIPDRSLIENGIFYPLYDANDTNNDIFIKTNSTNLIAKNWHPVYYRNLRDIPATTGTFDCATVNINESETEPVFGVYPNPATTTIHIHGGSENILVYDITGRLVKNVPNGENISLDISSWASGMYIVRCGRHMVKFIKHTSPNR